MNAKKKTNHFEFVLLDEVMSRDGFDGDGRRCRRGAGLGLGVRLAFSAAHQVPGTCVVEREHPKGRARLSDSLFGSDGERPVVLKAGVRPGLKGQPTWKTQ